MKTSRCFISLLWIIPILAPVQAQAALLSQTFQVSWGVGTAPYGGHPTVDAYVAASGLDFLNGKCRADGADPSAEAVSYVGPDSSNQVTITCRRSYLPFQDVMPKKLVSVSASGGDTLDPQMRCPLWERRDYQTVQAAILDLMARTMACPLIGSPNSVTCDSVSPDTTTTGSCDYIYKKNRDMGGGWDNVGGTARWEFACPAGTLEEDGGQCICPPNHRWVPSANGGAGECVRLQFFQEPPPRSCREDPSVGQPIYPRTGRKTHTADTGIQLQGWPLNFTYDSSNGYRGMPAQQGRMPVNGALGALWFSSLHRRLDGVPEGGFLSALREDGSSVQFAQVNSTWVSSDDRSGLLELAGNQYALRGLADNVLEIYAKSLTNPNRKLLKYLVRATGMKLFTTLSTASTDPTLASQPDQVLELTDPFGRRIQFRYQALAGDRAWSGIKQVLDPSGRALTPGYDGQGNLKSLTWQDDQVRGYVYDSSQANQNWALTGVIDEANKRYATFGYEASGLASSTQLAGGVNKFEARYATPPLPLVREVYDAASNVVWLYREWSAPAGAKIKQPNGSEKGMGVAEVFGTGTGMAAGKLLRFTGYSQPAGSGCSESSSSVAWDGNGRIVSQDDFNGKRTCYTHTTTDADGVRNFEKVRIEGLVNSVTCGDVTGTGAALPTGSRKISTKWHPDWAMKTEQAEPLLKTTWVYNGQPDPFNGNQIANCTVAKYGANSVDALPDGKPIAVRCRKVEQASKDANGAQGLTPALDSTVGQVNQRQWTYTYNQYGQVLTSTDPLGKTTTYEYRCEGSQYCAGTNKFVFAGTAPNETGYYQGDLWKVTNPQGHATEYTSYDRAGRVLGMTDPNGLVTTYSYTPRGWISGENRGGLETKYEYWPTGLLKKVTQPDQSYLYYKYDDAHRLTDVTDKVDANGNLIGNTVHYTLDNAGNRTAENVKDSSNALTRNITRTYDALNRLQFITGSQQ